MRFCLAACAGGGGSLSTAVPTPVARAIPLERGVNMSWDNPSLPEGEGVYEIRISWEPSATVRRGSAGVADPRRNQFLDRDGDGFLFYGEAARYAGPTADDDKCPSYGVWFDPNNVSSPDTNADTDPEGDGGTVSIGDLCDPANVEFEGRGDAGLENELSYIPAADSLTVLWQNPVAPVVLGSAVVTHEVRTPGQAEAVTVDSPYVPSVPVNLRWTNPTVTIRVADDAGVEMTEELAVESFTISTYNSTADAPEESFAPRPPITLGGSEVSLVAGVVSYPYDTSIFDGSKDGTYRLEVVANYADEGRRAVASFCFDHIAENTTAVPPIVRGLSVAAGVCRLDRSQDQLGMRTVQVSETQEVSIDHFVLAWRSTAANSQWEDITLNSTQETEIRYDFSSADSPTYTSYVLRPQDFNLAEDVRFGGSLEVSLSLQAYYVNVTEDGEDALASIAVEEQTPASAVKADLTNFVTLGPNFDGDALADIVDADADNDGILNADEMTIAGRDLVRESAIRGSFVLPAYSAANSFVYDSESPFYILEGLATASAYRIRVEVVTGDFESEDGLARRALYRPDAEDFGRGEFFGGTDPENVRRGVLAGEVAEVVTGVNTDGDAEPDSIDTDDDGDGLSDRDEGAGSLTTVVTIDGSEEERNCSLLSDCDGDGLADGEELSRTIERAENGTTREEEILCRVSADCDGDGLSDKDEFDSDLSNRTSGLNCLFLADCDGDGVNDAQDALPVDETETVDVDGDGVGDNADLCAMVANANNGDRDGDGLGDVCDPLDTSVYAAYDAFFSVLPAGSDGLVFEWETPEPVFGEGESITNTELASATIFLTAAGGVPTEYLLDEDSNLTTAAAIPATNRSIGARLVYELAGLAAGEYSLRVAFRYNNTASVSFPPQAADGSSVNLTGIYVGPDTDGDLFVDANDPDDDNDGVLDGVDSCPLSDPLGLPAQDRRAAAGDFDGDGCKNAEDDDDDNDGVADNADSNDYNSAVSGDADEDGIDDLVDNCFFTSNPDQQAGGGKFGAACVNNNAVPQLSALPDGGAIKISWVNPPSAANPSAAIMNISISLVGFGEVADAGMEIADAGALARGSFAVGETAGYVIGGLVNEASYNLSLTFRFVATAEIVSLPAGSPLMVTIGPNYDNDTMADAEDRDDDNDGVEDEEDPNDASTLGAADRDGDGVEDTMDDAPATASVQRDRDYDLVEDGRDNCLYEGTRAAFINAGDATIGMFYNPGQANADGDGQGDLCDGDDGNYADGILTRRPRTDAYYPPATDETTGEPLVDEDGEIVLDETMTVVNVTLNWVNPAELYLPSPPAEVLDLTSVRIEWVPPDNDGEKSLLPQLDTTMEDYFDPSPSAENMYRIVGLANGTLYNITIRGSYTDAEEREVEVVLATTQIETPASPQTVNFVVVGDAGDEANSGSARLFWVNPLLDKDTEVDPVVDGPQQLASVNITWWELDPLDENGNPVTLDDAPNAQGLLETFSRIDTVRDGTLFIERSGDPSEVTVTLLSYDGATSARQGATSDQLGAVLDGNNELLLEEGNFIAYELMGGLAANSSYLFQLKMSFAGAGAPAPLESGDVEFRVWTGANHDVPSLDGFLAEDEFATPDVVNALDSDDDNDGFADGMDTCQFTATDGIGVVLNNARALDVDQDGCHDAADMDRDLPAVTALRADSNAPNEVALRWVNPTAPGYAPADYISGFNITWTDTAGRLQDRLLSRPPNQPVQTSHSVAGLVGGSSASGDTANMVTYTDFNLRTLYVSEGDSSMNDRAANSVNVAAAEMNSLNVGFVSRGITSPTTETLEVTIADHRIPANPGTTLSVVEVQFSAQHEGTLMTEITTLTANPPNFMGQVTGLVGAQQHSMAIFASYDIDGAQPQKTLRIPIASFIPDDDSRNTVPLPQPLREFAAAGRVDQVVLSWLNPQPQRGNYLGAVVLIDGSPPSSRLAIDDNKYTEDFPPSAPGTTADPKSYSVNATYELWDEEGNAISGQLSGQGTASIEAGPISSGVIGLEADSGPNQITLTWENPNPIATDVVIARTEVEYHHLPAGVIPTGATFVNLSQEASTLSTVKGETGVTLTVDNLIGGYNYLFRITPFVSTSEGVVSLQKAEVTARANFPVVAVPTLTATDQLAEVNLDHTQPDNAPPKRAGDTTPANDATNYVVEMSTAGRQFMFEEQTGVGTILNYANLLSYASTGNNLTSGVPWTAAVRYLYPVGGSSDSSAASNAAIPKLPVPDMVTLIDVLADVNMIRGSFRFDLTTVDPSITVDVQVVINATEAGASNDNNPIVSGSYTLGMVSTPHAFTSNSLTGGLEYKAYLAPQYTLPGNPIPIAPEHIVGEGIAESSIAVPRLPTVRRVVATPVADGYPLGKVELGWQGPSDIPGTANDLVGFSLAIMNATNPAAAYTEDINLDDLLTATGDFFVLRGDHLVDYSRLEVDRGLDGNGRQRTPDAVFPGDELIFRVTPQYSRTGLLDSALAVGGQPSAEAAAAPYAAVIRAITPDYSSGMVNIDISTVFNLGKIRDLSIIYSSTDLGVPSATVVPSLDNPAGNADNFTLQFAMSGIFPNATTASGRFQFDAWIRHRGRNLQLFRAGRPDSVAALTLINRDTDGDGLLAGITDSPATPLDQCPVEQGNSLSLDFDRNGCRDTADETLAISGPTDPILVLPAAEAAGRISLDLSWVAADTTQDYYTTFTHYEISIRRHSGGESTFFSSQRMTDVAATTATLRRLAPGTTYSVAVRAVFRNMGGVQVFSRRSDYSTPVMTNPASVDDMTMVDDDGDGLIEIRTAAQLNNIRYVLDGGSYKSSATAAANTTGCPSSGCNGYELEDDISLATYANGTGWVPVGTAATGFSGIFEGNEYIIRNLTIAMPTTDLVGFFGSLTGGAQVRNVQFVDVDVTGQRSVGGLAGRAYGTSSAGVTIVNTSVEGSVAGRQIYLGGLVGLAGASGSRGTVIEASFFKGTILASGNSGRVGGLVGNAFPDTSSTLAQQIKIRASFARATITSSSTATRVYIGGLIGSIRGGVIENSYMHGSIIGEPTRHRDIGGLAGRAPGTSITNSYVVSPITVSTGGAAGIVLTTGSPTVTASYWASVTGAPTGGAGTRQTAAEMQVLRTTSNLYSAWTATCPNDSTKTIWSFAANRYPLIQCTLGGIDTQN